MDRWQTITDFAITKGELTESIITLKTQRLILTTKENIALLEPHCAEFLIHAADVEGKQAGIDTELVELLSSICTIPVTYAGGGRHLQDLELVQKLSGGRVNLTIGSALDIFGGSTIKFEEAVAWNERK
jgi:phosphoribosylformimino-5-aminoimidazole carboxamide ribotide isomerase